MTLLRASTSFLEQFDSPTGTVGQRDSLSASLIGTNISTQDVRIDPTAQSADAFHTQNDSQEPYPAHALTLTFQLRTGRQITTNTDFVVNATPDLARELLELGWVEFTPLNVPTC